MEELKGPAKTYYNSFLKAKEKLEEIAPKLKPAAYKNQLAIMETNLKNLRKISPSLDTSTLEEMYDAAKSEIDGIANEKNLNKDLEALTASFNHLKNPHKDTGGRGRGEINTSEAEGMAEYAKRDLAIFKKNNPDYDVSHFEDALRDFQQKYNTEARKIARAEYNRDDAKQALTYFNALLRSPKFFTEKVHTSRENELPEKLAIVDKQLAEYNDLLEEFQNASLLNRYWIDNLAGAKHVASFYAGAIKDAESMYTGGLTKTVVFCFQDLLFYEAHLRAAKIFFPEEAYFENAYREIADAIQRFGPRDYYMERVAENKLSFTGKLKMPKAATHNPALEAIVSDLYEQVDTNAKVLRVHLLQMDWNLERNELTSVIERRTREAALVIQNSDGSAGLVSPVRLVEDHFGGGNFTPARIYMLPPVQDFLLENLEA